MTKILEETSSIALSFIRLFYDMYFEYSEWRRSGQNLIVIWTWLSPFILNLSVTISLDLNFETWWKNYDFFDNLLNFHRVDFSCEIFKCGSINRLFYRLYLNTIIPDAHTVCLPKN